MEQSTKSTLTEPVRVHQESDPRFSRRIDCAAQASELRPTTGPRAGGRGTGRLRQPLSH